MGQSISAVREEARKENEQQEKAANDALKSLQDLAKLQISSFKSSVKDNSDKSKIPIQKMISEMSRITCGMATDGQKIAEVVKKSYKAFADGDIATGIGDVLGLGLDALFGSSTGNSNEEDRYFIAVGRLGYPLRIDMHLYTYMFTSETLTRVTKNLVAMSVVVSSVDLRDLDESTLGGIVEYCYGAASVETQRNILQMLLSVKDRDPKERPGKKPADGKASLAPGDDAGSDIYTMLEQWKKEMEAEGVEYVEVWE